MWSLSLNIHTYFSPRSSYQIFIVTYCIEWVTTSWTYIVQNTYTCTEFTKKLYNLNIKPSFYQFVEHLFSGVQFLLVWELMKASSNDRFMIFLHYLSKKSCPFLYMESLYGNFTIALFPGVIMFVQEVLSIFILVV